MQSSFDVNSETINPLGLGNTSVTATCAFPLQRWWMSSGNKLRAAHMSDRAHATSDERATQGGDGIEEMLAAQQPQETPALTLPGKSARHCAVGPACRRLDSPRRAQSMHL